MREQPSIAAVGSANTWDGETLAAMQDASKAHQGSEHIIDEEEQACTVLYHCGLAPLLSYMQQEVVRCNMLGGIMPHVPLPHNIWFAMHLDSFGSNGLIGERSSHKDLQGFTSQFPMRCKGQDLCGDFGNYHWEGTKGKNGWNQPYLDK